MTYPPNTFTSKTVSTNYVREGLNLGWRIGFRLSALYAICAFLIVESLDQGIGFFRLARNLDKFIITIFEFAAIAVAVFLVAIVPATILGTLTGMCLGKLVEITNERRSQYLFTLFGVLVCLTIATLIHLIFQIPVTPSFQLPVEKYFIGTYETYPIAIGIPSIIYVLTGGWVGWKLYSKGSTQMDGQG